MELASIKHIEPSQTTDFEADLFIACLGHETRSTVVARKFESHDCRKVALVNGKAAKDFSFQENTDYFEDHGFEIIYVESGVPDLELILQTLTGDSIRLLVDCTNMPPLWYHEFFSWFDRNQNGNGKVRMRVAYTMAAYVPQSGSTKVRKISSFLKDEGRTGQARKTALIMGLGQEKQVSESILNMINPDLLYLFYADPAAEKSFVEKVYVNNHNIISETPIRNLIAYPIRNGQEIYQSLINTILPLRNEYSIVLIPHGPKVFSLVSMLVHLGYPDIRISYPQFKKQVISDRLPMDEPVVLDILFEGEE